MASTQVTYGKKRSLLRTFGSRHRHRDFAISVSVPRDEVDTTPTKPIYEVEVAAAPTQSKRCSEIFHDCGGDSSNAEEQRHDATGNQHVLPSRANIPSKRRMENRQNCIANVRSLRHSILNEKPIMNTTISPLTASSATSITERKSLRDNEHGQTMHHNRRYTTSSAQLEKSTELLKLLETSNSVMDDDLALQESVGQTVQAPSTLAKCDNIAGQRFSSLRALGVGSHKASAEEINNKVREMLAAMDALKPSTTQKSQGTGKLSRVANSKVFARMSYALGRIYSKSASPEAKDRDQGSKGRFDGTGTPLQRSLSQANASQYSIRSIEIRLNEGTNLNKSKVQQIVGNQVSRKPVALRGTSFLCRKVDGRVDSRLSTPSIEGCEDGGNSSVSPLNPFETEDDFERNLEDGILNASPAGSSTPRICIKRPSSSSLDDTSVNDFSESSVGQVDLARIVVQVAAKDVGSPRIRQVSLQSPTVKELSSKPWQCSKRAREVQYDDFGIAKKHPSPSKRDLEELELAFQRYKIPNGLSAEEDVDELAASALSPGEALITKDPNRKLRNHGTQTTYTKAQHRPASRVLSTRIPRPLSQVGNRGRTEIRFAADFRPANAVPGELDELL